MTMLILRRRFKDALCRFRCFPAALRMAFGMCSGGEFQKDQAPTCCPWKWEIVRQSITINGGNIAGDLKHFAVILDQQAFGEKCYFRKDMAFTSDERGKRALWWGRHSKEDKGDVWVVIPRLYAGKDTTIFAWWVEPQEAGRFERYQATQP